MRHFVYYPFGIANMDTDTGKSRGHFIGRYGNEAMRDSAVSWTGGTPSTTRPVLGNIGSAAETVLIIDAHGNGIQFGKIENATARYTEYLEPADLAAQLAVDGLPAGFIWIKLNVCLSDNPTAADSQARALAMAMATNYPQIMVAGVKRSVFTHKRATEEFFRCMRCNSELPRNLGFRTAGTEDGAYRSWAGDDLVYYNSAGAAQKKSDVRPNTHDTKHKCPKCGELQPKDVGEYRYSEQLLRSIVPNVPDKPLSAFRQPGQPALSAAAAPAPSAAALVSGASSTARNKKCTKCNQLHVFTLRTTCIKCNAVLP